MKRRRTRGVVLISVMALMLLLSIIVVLCAQKVGTHARVTRHVLNRARASATAELGIIHAMWRLRDATEVAAMNWIFVDATHDEAFYSLVEHWRYGTDVNAVFLHITRDTTNDFHTIDATVEHPAIAAYQATAVGTVTEDDAPP